MSCSSSLIECSTSGIHILFVSNASRLDFFFHLLPYQSGMNYMILQHGNLITQLGRKYMDSTDFGCGILIGNQEKNKNINTMADLKASDDMSSLITCLAKIVKDGYTINFSVSEAGLSDVAGGKIYTPEEIKVSNFYRFEGPSDPSENAILYVIDTADGKKGRFSKRPPYGCVSSSR